MKESTSLLRPKSSLPSDSELFHAPVHPFTSSSYSSSSSSSRTPRCSFSSFDSFGSLISLSFLLSPFQAGSLFASLFFIFLSLLSPCTVLVLYFPDSDAAECLLSSSSFPIPSTHHRHADDASVLFFKSLFLPSSSPSFVAPNPSRLFNIEENTVLKKKGNANGLSIHCSIL